MSSLYENTSKANESEHIIFEDVKRNQLPSLYSIASNLFS